MRVFPLIGYLWLVVAPVLAEDKASERMADVVNMPGSVAVWDFVKREPGKRRFLAHVPAFGRPAGGKGRRR